MNPIKDKILGYLGLGVTLALGVICLFIFSYILLIGAVIGLLLFAGNHIHKRFFSHTKGPPRGPEQPGHRIIDHDPDE